MKILKFTLGLLILVGLTSGCRDFKMVLGDDSSDNSDEETQNTNSNNDNSNHTGSQQ